LTRSVEPAGTNELDLANRTNFVICDRSISGELWSREFAGTLCCVAGAAVHPFIGVEFSSVNVRFAGESQIHCPKHTPQEPT